MSKNTKKNKEKRIDELKKELENNDGMLKKNIDQHKTQVQIGLYQRHYPTTSPMYDTLIEKLQYDREEIKIKLETKFIVINPTFAYQQDKRWIALQIEIHQKILKAIENNLVEINKNVEEVENEITAQNGRIQDRRIQILGELEQLGVNISELKEKSPDYIG